MFIRGGHVYRRCWHACIVLIKTGQGDAGAVPSCVGALTLLPAQHGVGPYLTGRAWVRHVYTHVYAHVYTHIYAHVYTHIYMHVYAHVYTYVGRYLASQAWVRHVYTHGHNLMTIHTS